MKSMAPITDSNICDSKASSGHENQGMPVCVRNLTCLFCSGDKKSGIEGVSFSIAPGTFTGIYGKSGVGKSVLIKQLLFGKSSHTILANLISRVLRKRTINDGEIFLDGRLPETYVNNEVAYYPQTVSLPELLTCREYLSLANADRGNRETHLQERMDDILSQCALDRSILDKRIKSLSGGEKRRLGLAATLLETHLRMLIADEPTTGIDPDGEWLVMKTLQNISRKGITVLAITHSVTSASLMDRILVLFKKDEHSGARLSYDGPPPPASELGTEIIGYINGRNAQQATPQTNETPTLIQGECVSSHESQGGTRQILQWFLASLKLIYRDRKSLCSFLALAIFCVLSIQVGICHNSDNNYENTLLTLCSLAAPWLCAMFSAVFLAELRPLYSWEAFSGLKPHSFFFGTLLGQALPSFLIAIVFTIGLFMAVNTHNFAKKWIGNLLCSKYTYDLMVRNDANLQNYLSEMDLATRLKVLRSLYDSNQKTLLEKVLRQMWTKPSLTSSELKALSDEIHGQCPGIRFSEEGPKVDYTRMDSRAYWIPWLDKESLEGESPEILPFEADVIQTIEVHQDWTSLSPSQKDELKKTIEYFYWYHRKELLTYLLDYVILHGVQGWAECVRDCPGIIVKPSENSGYTIESWKNTPWFPALSAFLGRKAPTVDPKTLLDRIITENRTLLKNPLMRLYGDISNGTDNGGNANYPLNREKQGKIPVRMTLTTFGRVLLVVWVICMIGGTLGMTGTTFFGNSRESTIFVLVLFVAFIIFSRLFITVSETESNHVSYLQPFAENLGRFSHIRYGDSGVLLPIGISFLCLGRYASNLIAYHFTYADLTYEYLYMAFLFLLCLLIALVSLRRGSFALFKK